MHNNNNNNIKQPMKKMLFRFNNISAEILLHIVGCSFCAEIYILDTFLTNPVSIKSIKNNLAKASLLSRQKC
jgi:hypothetical protein